MSCQHPQKHRHPTKDRAKAQIASLWGAGKGSPDMSVYPCKDTDGTTHWHIGHDARKFADRIRRSIRSGSNPKTTYRRRA